MPDRLVGITVLPEFLQVEGVDAVLDNLVMKAGANAVTTSPYGNRELGVRDLDGYVLAFGSDAG